jgi:hypothetical protein
MLTSGFDDGSDFILCEEFLVDQVLEFWQGLLKQRQNSLNLFQSKFDCFRHHGCCPNL